MYTIKQLADMVGVTPKALRVYEQKALLRPARRSDKGYRLYDDTNLERLEKICRLRAFRFSLAEISELLALPDELLEPKLRQQSARLLADADRCQLLAVNLSGTEAPPVREKPACALLVINMQNDFTYGSLGFEKARALISPVAQYVEEARRRGMPVIFLNDCHDETDVREFYIWGRHAVQGSQGAAVCDDLKAGAADYFIDKHFYSGFFNTGLLCLLNDLRVNHLYVVGLDSNICVYQTVADAFNFGFSTTLLSDLTAAQYMTDYHSSLSFMNGNFSTVLRDSLGAD